MGEKIVRFGDAIFPVYGKIMLCTKSWGQIHHAENHNYIDSPLVYNGDDGVVGQNLRVMVEGIIAEARLLRIAPFKIVVFREQMPHCNTYKKFDFSALPHKTFIQIFSVAEMADFMKQIKHGGMDRDRGGMTNVHLHEKAKLRPNPDGR